MDEITPSSAVEPDPQVQLFLEMLENLNLPDLHELPPESAREVAEQNMTLLTADIDVETVEDGAIDGPDGSIPYRLYDPRVGDAPPSPLVLYFHGGGWVFGSLDTHDGPCRKLAAETGYPVLSIDYRLAPENPFPAGFEDCYAALEWAVDNAEELEIDPEQVVLAGDSAGGNLAAATAMFSRDFDGPAIAHQVLVYPATGDPTAFESYENNREGFYLTEEEMQWFNDCYFESDVDRGNIYALPRRADDLSDLPPTTVITAGFDPIRDDGAAFATRLREEGIPVDYRNYEGMIHGFWNMIAPPVDLEQAHAAYEFVVDSLEQSLEGVESPAR